MNVYTPLDIAPSRGLIPGSNLPAVLIAAAVVVVLIGFAVYFIKNRRK